MHQRRQRQRAGHSLGPDKSKMLEEKQIFYFHSALFNVFTLQTDIMCQ